jgi:hypothetical protein
MMRSLCTLFTLSGSLLVFPVCSHAQLPATSSNPPQTQKNGDVVVLSGVAKTARVADPNDRVVFNGFVMRMADFVAAVSSNSEALQHLRTPETHNHETNQPTVPLKPSN